MDYLLFDLIAVALPAVLVLRGTASPRRVLAPFGVLAPLALLWTAPWDEHLVRTGVWTYRPGAVLARLGSVPAEEYAFVALQVLLVSAWALRTGSLTPDRSQPTSGPRWRGALLWGSAAVTGLVLLVAGGHLRYLGLLLVWAAPPLALQHLVAGDVLAARRRARLLTALPVALWLATADRFAIAGGIWSITPGSSTGVSLLGLPVEEAVFFLLTCLLVADGALLVADPAVRRRVSLRLPAVRLRGTAPLLPAPGQGYASPRVP